MNGTRNNTVSFLDTYNKLMHFKQLGKARRKAEERKKTGGTPPMASSTRLLAYAVQRDAGAMTPRQRRRYERKLRLEELRQEKARKQVDA